MAHIRELPGWPEFSWDSEALAGPLAAVRHKQGKHLGRMEAAVNMRPIHRRVKNSTHRLR